VKARARQSGFTLIEVLIAAVLIGSVFVAVVSLMSQSLRNIDRMRPHELAVLHAREVMNQQLLRDELQPESFSGQWSDGYRWRVDVAALDFGTIGRTTAPPEPILRTKDGTDSATGIGPGTTTIFQVKVDVSWGERGNTRDYELQTNQWAKWMEPKQQ
jgi:type II secretion system protein I